MFELLLSRGADIEATTKAGNSGFACAVQYQKNPVVLKLLEMGYNTMTPQNRDSPLHVYCSKGLMEGQVLDKFKEKGIYPMNGRNNKGQTPLHCLLSRFWLKRFNKRLAYYVKLMVAFGADLGAEDEEGKTPLLTALANDLPICVIQELTPPSEERVPVLVEEEEESDPQGNQVQGDTFDLLAGILDEKRGEII
jgi:ankyrin repeat protein